MLSVLWRDRGRFIGDAAERLGRQNLVKRMREGGGGRLAGGEVQRGLTDDGIDEGSRFGRQDPSGESVHSRGLGTWVFEGIDREDQEVFIGHSLGGGGNVEIRFLSSNDIGSVSWASRTRALLREEEERSGPRGSVAERRGGGHRATEPKGELVGACGLGHFWPAGPPGAGASAGWLGRSVLAWFGRPFFFENEEVESLKKNKTKFYIHILYTKILRIFHAKY